MEYTEDRELVAELLRKTTRVQLGEAIFDNFHEVQLFKVAYEIAEPKGENNGKHLHHHTLLL